MDERTKGDREKGSSHIVKSLKAHINTIKLMMNKGLSDLMNITLYNELIKKFINSQCSQLLVALIRQGMVHTKNFHGNSSSTKENGFSIKTKTLPNKRNKQLWKT